jgi:hypothetical protein
MTGLERKTKKVIEAAAKLPPISGEALLGSRRREGAGPLAPSLATPISKLAVPAVQAA